MSRLILILLSFSITNLCLSQNGSPEREPVINDSLTAILIQKDLAQFIEKGAAELSSVRKGDNQLINIPMNSCADNEVYFSLSTFSSSFSTFITLAFTGTEVKTLESINFVTHSHFGVNVPESAIDQIQVKDIACNCSQQGKTTTCVSPDFKAFYSADRRRIYIRIRGEIAGNASAITLVFVNDHYYTRLVEAL